MNSFSDTKHQKKISRLCAQLIFFVYLHSVSAKKQGKMPE